MSDSNYIEWNEFEAEKLTSGTPSSRVAKGTGPDGKVQDFKIWTVPFHYEYPSGAKSAKGMKVEYPQLLESKGIRAKTKKGKGVDYTEYRMVGIVDLATEDGVQFNETFIEPFRERCLDLLLEHYETLFGKDKKTAEMRRVIIEQKFMSAFFLETVSKEDKTPVEGSNPRTVLVLKNFDNLKTLFTDVDGNKILPARRDDGSIVTYDDFVSTGMKFEPLVHFSGIQLTDNYYQPKSTVQSAIVYDVFEGQDENVQVTKAAEKKKAKYGNTTSALQSKLKTIAPKKPSPPQADPVNENGDVDYTSDKKKKPTFQPPAPVKGKTAPPAKTTPPVKVPKKKEPTPEPEGEEEPPQDEAEAEEENQEAPEEPEPEAETEPEPEPEPPKKKKAPVPNFPLPKKTKA